MTPAVISILIQTAVRSLLFAAAAGLALKLLRVRDVGARLAAWTAVLYGALLMPLAVAIAPPLNVSVQRAIAHPSTVLATHTEMVQVGKEPLPIAPAQQPPFDWRIAVITGYSTITALLLARFVTGWMLTQRLRRSSRRIEDSRLLQSVAGGVRRAPVLLESDQLAVPITLGWRSPSILLPASWRKWEQAQLDAVLAHELSHIYRGDYATLLLSSLNRCLFWFSPLSWWLDRHLRDLAEQASDDCALRATADHARYAEVLLGFFEALHNSRGRIRWQGVAMASSGRANRRIDRILATGRRLSAPTTWPVLAGLAGITIPLLYLSAAVTPREQTPAPPQPLAHSAFPEQARLVLQPIPAAPRRLLAQATPPGQPAQPTPQSAPATPTEETRDKSHDGYVIVHDHNVTMSGSTEDLARARSFRYKIGGEYMWFRRDGKAYIIRDKATLQAAQKLFEPQEDLGRQQSELGALQSELGARQAELGARQSSAGARMPDLTRDIERLKERLRSSGTAEQLAEVQALLGEMQAKAAAQQALIGDQQAKLGEEQAKLGGEQAKLGQQQAVLGKLQAQRSQEAMQRLRVLIDEAIRKGLAEPEPR